MSSREELDRLDAYRWRVPKAGAMRVDGLIYANERIIDQILAEKALEQVKNVACLPGIAGASLAMPDAHWGYGFPIGGVAAFDAEEGVISPGGVGYDINCGCRLLASRLTADEVRPHAKALAQLLFNTIPSGVGSRGKIKLSRAELKKVLREGVRWTVREGLATPEDEECAEDHGRLPVEDVDHISDRALQRGNDQVGTLGSGNHFIEIQRVETVYDAAAAQAFGLFEGQVVVMLHSGSRGLGYQVCDDFLKIMAKESAKAGFVLPDRQLACAPMSSRAAGDYLSAMNAAANYAWANRQAMTHGVRAAFEDFFRESAPALGMRLVYDVCHNIAKIEEHEVEGVRRRLVVHRKGATRAFGPGSSQVPERYRAVGQPVLIPGDMGRASYVLAGAATAMRETFGSTCHGAGRVLSRTAALKRKSGAEVRSELEAQGIFVLSSDPKTLAEEMPAAYKDVDEVVETVHGAGLARKVARMRPMAVVKG